MTVKNNLKPQMAPGNEACEDKQQRDAGSKVRKKARFKKVYWLLLDLAIVFLIFVLLLHKPGGYEPSEPVYDEQLSPYLTHELLPQIYNGSQYDEPFELVITQEGINDIIARSGWPKESEGMRFLVPKIFFTEDNMVLIGTAELRGVEFVCTFVARPYLDEDGLLNLRMARVKVGAMNITLLARILGKRMYARRLEEDAETETLQAKVAASLLNNEPFEPVFEVPDVNRKVRVDKITVTPGKLTIRLVPISG